MLSVLYSILRTVAEKIGLVVSRIKFRVLGRKVFNRQCSCDVHVIHGIKDRGCGDLS